MKDILRCFHGFKFLFHLQRPCFCKRLIGANHCLARGLLHHTHAAGGKLFI